MKKRKILLPFLLSLFLLIPSLLKAKERKIYGEIKINGTCNPKKPYPGISADELMKIWFDIKYTRYAKDYWCKGLIRYIDKSGFTRTKKWIRKRIILAGKKKDFDYKDVIVITHPQDVKGLSVLTWAYLTPGKEQDIWIWLPSLKKIRRVSQAEEDDSFLGSEFTVEEISTRRFGYETYKMLGEAVFPGYHEKLLNETFYKGTPCYKILAKPKRKRWYYDKRIIWVEKTTGAVIFDEYYDKTGRKFKTIFRLYDYPKEGCITARIWEVKNLRTGHMDIVDIQKTWFNTGLKERFFTEKTLERMQW